LPRPESTNVRVIPSTSNHIRAYAAAHPKLRPIEIANALGVHHHLVELELGRGDTRRPKSVAT
jgi:hypothetical protein